LPLLAAGEAVAWGKYLHYVGPGQFTTNSMVAPAGLSGMVSVVSGLQHASAMRHDGQVVGMGEWAWGLTNVPAHLTNAMMVAAGDYHTVALTRTRQVVAWGASFNNQCLVPPEATNIVAVAAGGFHSLALRADGQIICWGDNRYGQCTVPAGLTNVVALAAGTWHSLALLENGRVAGWGNASAGQLNFPASLTNAIGLAARSYYSLALRADGSPVGWGLSDAGQLSIPVGSHPAIALAAGERHALAALRNGSVVAWGANSAAQTSVPPTVSDATAAGAGGLHSIAVLGGVPPAMVPQQPEVVIRVDRRVLLTAGVPGSQPMAYQWRRDGTTLPGATGALLAIPRAQTADAGSYSVIASNAAGVVTNPVARLGVWVPEVATARFLHRDDSSLGNWRGAYGTVASMVLGHATNDPSGFVSLTRGQTYVFQTNSPDARALERVDDPSPTNRFLACVFDADFIELRCALPLRQTNQLALFLMEPGGGRSESVEVFDQLTGDLLDRRTLTSLTNGSYLAWELAGPVRLRVNRIAGANALLSGVFLGRAVGLKPAFRAEPNSQVVPLGSRAVLAGGASGEPPLFFQWHRNGQPLTDGPLFKGARSPVLTVNAVTSAEVGGYTLIVSNAQGLTTSATATLALPAQGVPPTVISAPHNVTTAVGMPVNFSVTSAGTAPFAYQWRFNGASLSGRTQSTLALATVQLADAGAYSVVVTNGYGAITSAVATLTVTNPGVAPTITAQPQSRTNVVGATVNFTVTAAGTAPLAFQWRFNGASLSGRTQSTLALAAIQHADAGAYSVVVTNGYGAVTSAVATLTVTNPGVAPTITAQPQSRTNVVGATVNFTVTAAGTAPLAFQWRFNGASLSGRTQSTLALAAIQHADAGAYSVVVTNGYGAVTSAVATLTVTNPGVAPTITKQPQSRTNVVGATVNFSVTSAGTAPFAYQWRFNGASLSGRTQSTLALAAVQLADAGAYSVVVTNGYGAVTSAVATLTITNPGVAPTITTQPQSRTNVVGATVNFTVTAAGTAPLAFQWRFNGASLPGRTQSTLALAAVQLADAGTYSVVVTNGYGAVTSTVATLTVTNPGVAPTITTQPQSRTNLVGSTVSFSVEAAGTGPLSYQWLFGGLGIPGGTNDTLNLTAIQITDAGGYAAVVANAFGTVTSSVATLTVQRLPRKVTESEDMIVNRPPQPMPDFLVITNLGSVTITPSQLLANDLDPDGDPLSLLSVGPTTRRGGTVGLSHGAVVYMPPAGPELWDAFDYVVQDGEATATATVTLQFGSASNGSRLTPVWDRHSAVLRLNCSGVPGRTYLIQTAPSLPGAWQNLSTNVAGTNGAFEWTEPANPGAPRRFYRTALP
jgi:hypothetical protein